MSDKAKREEELADLRWVMSDPRGRRAVRRIIRHTWAGGTLLQWHRLDVGLAPEQGIWYIAGRQDVGNYLQDEAASASPQGFQLMNKEAFAAKVASENAELNKGKSNEEDE
jgi:hypothetical protein